MNSPARSDSAPAAALAGWTVAVVGLGTMGAGMASRIADSGAALRVFNRTSDRARTLLSRPGVVLAGTPVEAADGADVVLVSVADDAALRDVLTGPDGVFTARPAVVVNATTVAPNTVRDLARQGSIVDAGVLGNGEHARSGLLRWYVGGAESLVRSAVPVLDALGKQVLHVGELGSGMTLKLAMNLLMGIEMQALAEVTALGVAGGLDRGVVLDAVSESGFAAPVMRFKAERMARRRYSRPDFRLRLMAKDFGLAMGLAESGGITLPMSGAAAHTHAEAVDSGLGDQDCAAVVRVFDQRAGEQG